MAAKPAPAWRCASKIIESCGLPVRVVEARIGPGGVVTFLSEPPLVDVGDPILSVGTIDEVFLAAICYHRGLLCAEPERKAQRDQQDEEGKSFHRGAEYMVLARLQAWKRIFRRRLSLARLGVLALIRDLTVFAFDGDAEGAEEVHVVLGELGAVFVDFGGVSVVAFLHFIEADGGLKHEQDVEAVLADILDDTCDQFAFDDGFMDGFTELLDQFAQARCHRLLRQLTGAGNGAGAAMKKLPY